MLVNIFSLDITSRLGGFVNFFIYDSLKIMLLLFVMISIVGYLRTYLPSSKVREWIAKQNKIFGHLLASIFGAITPFCSCSSIPLFLSFLRAGIPMGITFSFLITSPLVNEYLVVLMLGFFGWKITAIYVLSGIIVGVISGMVLGGMKLEKYLVKDIHNNGKLDKEVMYDGFKERMRFGLGEAVKIVKKLWYWILFGVGLGAVIHNFVPQELIHSVISRTGMFTVPIAVVIGVPMYGSCAAIVPIAVALFQKGIPLGTALAFMMAVSALSLPEAIILRRAMNLRLIAAFFGIVAAGIIVIGYLINALSGWMV